MQDFGTRSREGSSRELGNISSDKFTYEPSTVEGDEERQLLLPSSIEKPKKPLTLYVTLQNTTLQNTTLQNSPYYNRVNKKKEYDKILKRAIKGNFHSLVQYNNSIGLTNVASGLARMFNANAERRFETLGIWGVMPIGLLASLVDIIQTDLDAKAHFRELKSAIKKQLGIDLKKSRTDAIFDIARISFGSLQALIEYLLKVPFVTQLYLQIVGQVFFFRNEIKNGGEPDYNFSADKYAGIASVCIVLAMLHILSLEIDVARLKAPLYLELHKKFLEKFTPSVMQKLNKLANHFAMRSFAVFSRALYFSSCFSGLIGDIAFIADPKLEDFSCCYQDFEITWEASIGAGLFAGALATYLYEKGYKLGAIATVNVIASLSYLLSNIKTYKHALTTGEINEEDFIIGISLTLLIVTSLPLISMALLHFLNRPPAQGYEFSEIADIEEIFDDDSHSNENEETGTVAGNINSSGRSSSEGNNSLSRALSRFSSIFPAKEHEGAVPSERRRIALPRSTSMPTLNF